MPPVRFELQRLAPAQEDPVGGIYENGAAVFLVSRFGEFGKGLFLTDLTTGEVGPLYATKPAEWLWAASIASPVLPERGRLALRKVGDLELARAGASPRRFRPRALARRPVRFESGVALAGSVLLPPGTGPRPGVVLVHGSNDEDRDHLGPFALFFASQGYAVLTYDKRGCGESGGDWKTATFADLAADAAAAVRTLRAQPEVDPRRVGLWGVSQGGWIAPVVAEADPALAFVILHAGPAVTPAEQGYEILEGEMRPWGFDKAEIDKAVGLQRLSDEVTRGRKPWAEYKARYDQAVAAGAEWIIAPADEEDSAFRRLFRGILDFDPSPHWAKVRCPVLALFGDRDWIVPADPNATLLPQAFPEANRRLLTVRVLPGANHVMMRADTGTRAEYASADRFVPAYFEAMASWLRERMR